MAQAYVFLSPGPGCWEWPQGGTTRWDGTGTRLNGCAGLGGGYCPDIVVMCSGLVDRNSDCKQVQLLVRNYSRHPQVVKKEST